MHETAESLATVKKIRIVLAALHFADKQEEAMLLLQSLYDLFGMEYPKDFLIIEQNEDARRILINEFLLDIDDLMYDYQVER